MRAAALGAGPDDRLGEQHLGAERTGLVGVGQQRDVERPVVHAPAQIAALVDGDVDGDRRMRLRETLQHMRQHALAVIVRRAEPHHADNVGNDELRHHLAVDRQQPAGIAEQHLAIRGQRHRTGVAREHGAAENVLQLLDLHGDGRRRAEDGIGRGGEAAGLGDRHESAQNVEVEQRQRMIEWGVHGDRPSIFLMQTIIPFRLIEHQIGRIVNSIEGRTYAKAVMKRP